MATRNDYTKIRCGSFRECIRSACSSNSSLQKTELLWRGPITVTHPDIVRYLWRFGSCSVVIQAGALARGGNLRLDMGQQWWLSEKLNSSFRIPRWRRYQLSSTVTPWRKIWRVTERRGSNQNRDTRKFILELRTIQIIARIISLKTESYTDPNCGIKRN